MVKLEGLQPQHFCLISDHKWDILSHAKTQTHTDVFVVAVGGRSPPADDVFTVGFL